MVKDNQLKLSPYSKIKVYWDDRPENYSKEGKNRIRNHFAKKYGVNKNNIDVIYRPVKFTENGDVIEIDGASIENIMDVTYQRELMREWIKRENKVVDFERIIKLDDKVNGELNLEDNHQQHKSWSIKWITLNNFLSFGDNNFVPFNKLKGLTIVNSVPANQGGKTTLTIDALKFLLHGNTTKTDKNEDVFNTFRDKNELVVRGMIDIGGEEIIIERKMKRSAKKAGGWTVTNKVNYYELLPDGEEKELNEEDAKRTTAKLRETVGSEKDFEMLVLATEKNLDDLIGLTTTESGKVLTRLIGLEVIEMKEAVVRKMYNEFDKKKKSNDYDIITLNTDIEDHKEKISAGNEIKQTLEAKLEQAKNDIVSLNEENDRLLNSKITIDVSISALNPTTLQEQIDKITEQGKALSARTTEFTQKIEAIGDIEFDEDTHHALVKEENQLLLNKGLKRGEITRLQNTIQDLIDGGICKSCNRKLDDVDNTEHINQHTETINKLTKEVEALDARHLEVVEELKGLNEVKVKIDEKNRLELQKAKLEVEIGALRNEIVAKRNDLKKYKLNQEAIDLNRSIDAEVQMVKTKIAVATFTKDDTVTKLERIRQEIQLNEQAIVTKTALIEQIKKEEEIERIYKIYIDLVGKKGISKLVLRSVLPIINAEVQRLLDGVCDFEIEIFIDDKNDVQFLLNKDETSKALKSGSGFEKTAASLALRGVLGKLSTLPMPNFITFDEVMGKVSNDNLEKLKPLFDKIKNMYEIVFLITHNDVVKDWGDNIVTVRKPENVSEVTIS